MMKCKNFIAMLKVALNEKTVYANGMFGQPITNDILEQKARQLKSWYIDKGNLDKLKQYVGKYYFGFDCVCLIKGILWGWNANFNDENGGAKYQSNNVPDISLETILTKCNDVSSDFSNICKGAYVYMKGHCGIYIGNGEVIECTPKWENKVQISKLGNLGFTGEKVRKWEKWGKLPYIDYSDVQLTYTVVKDDTLSGIAKEFDVSLDSLIEINDIKDPNMIYVGQVIVIPQSNTNVATSSKPTEESKKEVLYIVKKGDGFYKIARQFAENDKVNLGEYAKQIALYNDLYLNSTIYAGQGLKIPEYKK